MSNENAPHEPTPATKSMEQPTKQKPQSWWLVGLILGSLAILFVSWRLITFFIDLLPFDDTSSWIVLLAIVAGSLMFPLAAGIKRKSWKQFSVASLGLILSSLVILFAFWQLIKLSAGLAFAGLAFGDAFTWIDWIVLLAVVAGSLLLPLAAGVKQRSWKRFFEACVLSIVGIYIPLFVFLASTLLTPRAKVGCNHGWVDCFYTGKLALTPLVLWALAALYMADIMRRPLRAWMALGITVGAVVSTVCLAIGLFIGKPYEMSFGWFGWFVWYSIPVYVSVWFTVRAFQMNRAYKIKPVVFVQTFLASLPFWIASVLWSKWIYGGLPQEYHGCFVVTAACQGHRTVVGPLVVTQHDGHEQNATHQLITLWRFEDLWKRKAPQSHTLARSVYNRIGPLVAGLIRGPLRADIAYLAIKPIEIVARVALRVSLRT